MKYVRLKAALFALALIMCTPVTWAASAAIDGKNVCTEINCTSLAINGVYNSSGTGFYAGNTWVYQVWALGGDCLRLDVQAGADLEMAVVSPDPAASGPDPEGVGYIWADDDSGDGANPLVKIDPVPRTGYYTVVVSAFDTTGGSRPFVLRYGRYPTGNPNCSPPTPPGTKGLVVSQTNAKLDNKD